jgi:hypothetical protein
MLRSDEIAKDEVGRETLEITGFGGIREDSEQTHLESHWCPEPDSNRHGWLKPRDFKSLASTDFATRARERASEVRGAIVLISQSIVSARWASLLIALTR